MSLLCLVRMDITSIMSNYSLLLERVHPVEHSILVMLNEKWYGN